MKNEKIKIIFIGTSDFGLPSLKKLVKDDSFDLQLVITQPDQPAGRKQELAAPPIKIYCQENCIQFTQPDSIGDIRNEIQDLSTDLILVIAYGQIIPKSILDLPKHGCINVHGSLLPKYRGAACVQAPILNSDDISGVTIMKMDEGLDTGPILTKHNLYLSPQETFGTLHEKLSLLASENIVTTIKGYIDGSISPLQQEGESSYVKRIKKTDGKIDWKKDAKSLERFVRAMNPWPGAYSYLNGEKSQSLIKIIKASYYAGSNSTNLPGTIFTQDGHLLIACNQDSLEVLEIQPEGKRPLSAKDFINGYPKLIGKILE